MFGDKLGAASRALLQYKREVFSGPEEHRESLQRHAAAAEDVIAKVRAGEKVEAGEAYRALTWQVGDSFAKQPPAYKKLARTLKAISAG